MKSKILYIAVFLTLANISLKAQPYLTPLKKQHFPASLYKFSDSRNVLLTLPFFEDFSSYRYSHYPDPTKWEDSLVFINNSYPVNPPSIGVATFNGLDENGLPYASGINIDGKADSLTSMPLDFSMNVPGDSIYLSFFYQPQGNGDDPEAADSLVLLFKINDTVWNRVWGVPGSVSQGFRQVMIPIKDAAYLHNNFQFRFMNYASITGNEDTWNIDYIRIETGRTYFDTLLNDVAFTQEPTSYLKNYVSMPYDHFYNFQSQELLPEHYTTFKNHFNLNAGPTLNYKAEETISNTPLFTSPDFSLIMPPFSERVYPIPMSGIVFPASSADSLNIRFTYTLKTSLDTKPGNDTLIHDQLFSNYFAYDDGIAEEGFGLHGRGAQLAYKFTANKPDTLKAIQVHFAYLNQKSTNAIAFRVWKNIAVSGGSNELVYESELLYLSDNAYNLYIDSLNGFYTHILTNPIPITGDFYIGFFQEEEEDVNIGFDINHNSQSKLFINSDGIWEQSPLEGALMLRPVVGNLLGLDIPEKLIAKNNFEIYPNPTSNLLHLFGISEDFSIQIFDVMGRSVLSRKNERSISVQELLPGIYILQATTSKGVVSKHFIKE